ncbi:MAG: DNA repair protein RecO [Dehalococcoidales bacterium]|nr:DNA repair protein RecO [Dehalococcoidales bacterium]
MTKPRNYQTEAIIIKKVKLGEADRILTLYTPHLGKIQGVAKGIRRPRSKLAGHLELLTYSLVSLAHGRNLDIIIGSQTIESFLSLKSDLWLTSCALYATELINQFTADHIENQSLFWLLLETIRRLSEVGDIELVLRHYEMHLLNEVGYRPELMNCASCHSKLKPVTNVFSPSSGGVLCPKCSRIHTLTYPLSVNTLKVLRLLQNSDYETASKIKMNPDISREMENVITHYIEYLLERGVKSAVWLNILREQIKEETLNQVVISQ